jgi:hypothetical protein
MGKRMFRFYMKQKSIKTIDQKLSFFSSDLHRK